MASEDREVVVGSESRNTGVLWIAVAVAVVVVVGLFAYGSSRSQQQTIAQLNAHQADLTSTIGQLQGQLSDVTAKLNDVQNAQTAAANQAAAAKAQPGKPDPRWNRVQTQLNAEKKQLDQQQSALTDQQNSLNQARTDLQNTISANHDELTGSIARTHDELVALEQKGERNYDEFDLTKGKGNRLTRVGPISLAVRKTDAKHSHYDLAMMIDDKQMTKKNVNLYEPVWIGDSQESQPVQIVVNKIDKDHIHGYVASAKYTSAQMRPASAPANAASTETPSGSAQAPSTIPQSN